MISKIMLKVYQENFNKNENKKKNLYDNFKLSQQNSAIKSDYGNCMYSTCFNTTVFECKYEDDTFMIRECIMSVKKK